VFDHTLYTLVDRLTSVHLTRLFLYAQGMGGAVKKAEMIVATLGGKGKLLQHKFFR